MTNTQPKPVGFNPQNLLTLFLKNSFCSGIKYSGMNLYKISIILKFSI